jgi:cytochrome c biogenesis protein CcmG/thiol:disulfide interchange protein DsbE
VNRALALAVLFAIAGLAPGCQGKPAAGAVERRPAPAVRGETVGGGELDLSELSGQVILLNLWATWCEP